MVTPIAEARRKMGITTRELARICGVNVATVYNVERGMTAGNIRGKLRDGLQALGIDVDDLERQQVAFVKSEALRLQGELMARPCSTA